ncbi:MAG: polyprenyl synthetase family protein [Sporolactobacillus sp.]|jgi:heptaprenyl diphosphate synthase|nr:polyprenyl synthetase family protein [Sporolactobacillus sp.]
MSITRIYAEQKENLAIIEKKLAETLETSHSILHDAALNLLRAGGKRIRPLLVLFSSEYGDPLHREVIDAAVTLELIHMASLVHDDIVDDSDLRRGKPTVRAQWDNRVAIYTGDYIFAKAIELIAQFEHPKVHLIISRVIRDLSLGEIDQIRDLYNWHQNLRCYLRRIKRKTALLMALSCQLGAIAGGCGYDLSRRLYYFGYFLGMSYQITDDILDFVGTQKQLGKPAGSDLRSGNITLPTFYALRDPSLRESIVAVLDASHPGEKDWRTVIDRIRQSDAVDRSQRLSDRYLQKAVLILEALPKTAASEPLREIAAYVGERNY